MATCRHHVLAASTALTGLVLSAATQASGFRIPELSATGLGMANAVVANAEEPGALIYNPAAMAFHEGMVFNGGLAGLKLNVHVDPENGEATDSTGKDSFVVPNLYFMQQISDQWSWGFGLSAPFGLETKWPAGTFQTFADVAALTTPLIAALEPEASKIEMVNLNPNVAYRLGPNTSVSAGVMYYMLRELVFNTQGISIDGDGNDFGWNLGIQHVAGPWSFGASYRSRVKVEAKGSVDASSVLPPGAVTSSDATAEVEFPDMLQLGTRYAFNEAWAVEFDYEWTGWSAFDVVEITHSTDLPGDCLCSTNNWENSSAYRLAASYNLNDATQLRFGYSWDETPQPDKYFSARVPDADRQLLSIGIGYDFGTWELDAGYMYVLFDNRTVDRPASSYLTQIATGGGTDPNGTDAYNGEYESSVHLLALSASVKF